MITRKLGKLAQAGGHACDLGGLKRMLSGKLHLCQHSSFDNCVQENYQMDPELARGLIAFAKVHTKDEARAAGVMHLIQAQCVSG